MTDYTGNVTVGGPADVRDMPALTLTKVAVGPFNNNAYLLQSKATGTRVLIDAANDPDTLLDLIGDDGLTAVITTHQHGDHWQALEHVVTASGATTYAGRFDADGIPVPTDVLVGDTIRIGDIELTAIHLVGHTAGSIALLYTDTTDPDGQPHLITGDCLFPGGIGNTEKNPERFDSLYQGVVTKIFDRLPDTTWIYPGHGNDTTLETERPHLEEWKQRGW